MAEPDNKKKKPNYYMQSRRKKYVLETGLKGFLCSCNFREKECVRESYNILNQYADLRHPQPQVEEKSNESDAEDISDELSKEVNAMKNEQSSQKRFQVVESGAKNFIFIRTTVAEPVELVSAIINDIVSTKSQKTKFLLRLVPIEATCKANLVDIKTTAQVLMEKHFSGEPKSFAIVFNHRNNNQINRDEVIKEIAALITAKNDAHKVDLKNAQLSVIIEIIRAFCLMSIVPDYMKHKKYNLLQLAETAQVEPETTVTVQVEPETTETVGLNSDNDKNTPEAEAVQPEPEGVNESADKHE